MQSDELDKKIKEAADHHHPSYDEKAWARMEKLLNKHLPEKEDSRKRGIFFLLIFLFLGAGATWFLVNKSGKHEPNTISNKTEEVHTPVPTNKTPGNTDLLSPANVKIPADPSTPIKETVVQPEQVQPNPVYTNLDKSPVHPNKIAQVLAQTKNTDRVKPPVTLLSKTDADDKILMESGNGVVAKRKEDNKLNDGLNVVSKPSQDKTTTDPSSVTEKNTSIVPAKITQPEEKKEVPVNPATPQVAKNKKGNEKRKSFFFFSLSAGGDMSAVRDGKIGSTKLLAGGGIGYTFRDKFTLRTGFYSGRKIYTAAPEDYNPPNGFWNYYPYMEKIDANCKVYEIPLSLSYNFGHSSVQHWFTSAGLSSYLMKKETYNYFYKSAPGGPTYNSSWTLKDQNKHYFSVLTLSGGYQRNLGNTFSITAEPYLKVPLSGVGYGKVKLNSGGVLFTVGIKPFQRKSQ